MKNSREYVNLLEGTKHKDLIRMARNTVADAASKSKPELVAALVADRWTYRFEMLREYLESRKARLTRVKGDPNQAELFA